MDKVNEKLDKIIELLEALLAMQGGVNITYERPLEIYYPPVPSPTGISGGSYP